MVGMVDFYVKRILSGKMTIDQVPDYWRADVEEALKNLPNTNK